jgi:predicted RecB family nuclease
MKHQGSALSFSPSDLNGFLACPHLTSLELAVVRDELKKPFRPNAQADLIRAKGYEHEAAYLQRLRDEGCDVVEIDLTSDFDWERAAVETEEAMRAGREVVYQAVLVDDAWRGIADFVMRQPGGTYEALDTKLARHTRPAHILQLCFYTEQIARIQASWPREMRVVTGTGAVESFRPDDYLAFYRRLRRRFLDAVENGAPTYPYPVEHCSLCDFLSVCKHQWADDDHLVLVAGISRAQHRFDPLPVEKDRGFALMPEPSAGDIWLDLEGDPWYEPARGLEYLFGWVYLDGDDRAVYDCIWAHDRAEEKAGFERLVDFLVERRRRYLGMHVYHYAAYERTALTRLMGEHGTRENEIDDLLRGEMLVDLFRVLRQALRASVPNYSIKTVEELYDFERTAEVGGGSESVVAFEQWLELGDDTLLDGIRAYNEEDCRSLYELHKWLLRLRPEELAWRAPPEERVRSEEAEEAIGERERVRDALCEGAQEGERRWLLAQLLEYHRREEKPQWWAYFNNLTLDEEELIASTETLAALGLAGEPVEDKQSLVYTLSFPPQEHKIGGSAVDPATQKNYDVRVDDERGIVTLRRSKKRADESLPSALIPPEPLHAGVQREALLRFARDQSRFPALVEILERRPPKALLDGGPVDAALSLDRSYLFVQGPPGSGKTHWGARMAVALMQAGQRVGVTALTHRAIRHFLTKVEEAAHEAGFSFRGRKKGSDDEETRFEGRFIDCTTDNADMLDDELQLIAGTSWLFSRSKLEGHVNTLFVDEGGQFALADALAVGTAARNLVLLGDPNQLPQVSQGAHPPGANASVLSHLLGADETVRPEMGLFLERTWRLRPEVNDFISETFYEGRLEPAEVCRTRSLAVGNGLRYIPVEEVGRRISSPEEAKAVRAEVDRLVGTAFRDGDRERPLTHADIVVVAPYNAQVRCLREHLPTAVRVGTVDKFQGQEAAVVFYSMASSSGEDVPRGLDFLFSRNRLNVAISRAECLAYLVASPRLLDASCRTVEQMRLANALCRLVELAEEATAGEAPFFLKACRHSG